MIEKLAAGLAVALLGLTSAAWACTAQPTVFGLSPASAAPNSVVTLSGANVNVTTESVEIRWNSIDGLLVGSAPVERDGSFSASAVVPEVNPGVYYLLITGGGGVVRQAFEVLPGAPGAAKAPNSVSSDAWGGFEAAGGGLSGSALEAASPADLPAMRYGMSLVAVGLISLAVVGLVARRRRFTAG